MPLIDTLRREKQEMKRKHEAELAEIDSCIACLSANAPLASQDAPRTHPVGHPNLNGLRIIDAIRKHLEWAESNNITVTMDDLRSELAGWHVVGSRGALLSNSKFPLKTITNVLFAPNNAAGFKVERSGRVNQNGSRKVMPGDRIELVKPKK
jgi:hypothetical protein